MIGCSGDQRRAAGAGVAYGSHSSGRLNSCLLPQMHQRGSEMFHRLADEKANRRAPPAHSGTGRRLLDRLSEAGLELMLMLEEPERF